MWLSVKNAQPDALYTVTNILGQVIARGIFNGQSQILDVSQLAPGMYLLNNTRFIKE